jgi:2-iminobutanoate/2-iminopropanoate deaminase
MDRKIISTSAAPAPIGPYSQGVRVERTLYCSGQIALDPTSGELVGETAGEQATKCLSNLQAICEAGETSLDNAVRVTVYLANIDDFEAVNQAYSSFFSAEPPARVAIGVSDLPKGAKVEIDAVVGV